MSDERPEALLKSALEKIVYFEARSKQLENDVTAARAEVERLKAELAAAGQREIELRRYVAGIEVELSRAHRERDELARLNATLRAERTSVLEQLIESARLHAAGSEDTPIDLAAFISQLRAEALNAVQAHAEVRAEAKVEAKVEAKSIEDASFEFASSVGYAAPVRPQPAWAAHVVPGPAAQAATAKTAVVTAAPEANGVAAHAERFWAEGRLQVSAEDVERLSASSSFAGRAEETLFGFSLRELSAPDASARARAAERLRALGQSAAAPALAAALHAEREPSVQVALLSAFGELAEREGAAVVLPLLDAPSPDVRVAALKALLKLDPTQAGPHLSAAMRDPDRAVRRRASLLALGLEGEAARSLGEQAVRDEDAEVRALGARVLGASGGEHARALLLTALRDPERKVRKAAAESLSRILGEDLSAVVDLDDPQRRREVRRLASLPVKPVQRRVLTVHVDRRPDGPTAPVPPRANLPPVPAVEGAARADVRVAEPHRGTADAGGAASATAPAEAPSVARADAPGERLCAQLANELRVSIRGRTVAELASITNEPAPQVVEACELLVARGQAVKRGKKFFAA
ncbi:MAG: HEAT repeat domain-containing protein [Myxococcaceae bacterium]|nr:HEAT repeat domain-containing protein [Myxococcaceae bacterium]